MARLGVDPRSRGRPTSPQQFVRDEVCSLGVVDLALDLCLALESVEMGEDRTVAIANRSDGWV